jgi:hypothetical protein
VNYGHVAVPPDELNETMIKLANTVVDKANSLLAAFGEDRGITSGWRPVEVNKLVPGAALMSNHTRCMAIDIADPEGDLDEWCMDHQDELAEMGLWLEHPASTKGWCHVQIVAPRSGNRVFYP